MLLNAYTSAKFLSKRDADNSNLLDALEKDPNFKQGFFAQGLFDQKKLQSAVDYIVKNYNTGENEAEECIKHLLRRVTERQESSLSNRIAQQQSITIPSTSDHPVPRTIPIEKVQQPPPAHPPVSIDPIPPETSSEKVEDVTKPVVDQSQSKQQKVIDAIKACKVTNQALAQATFGVEMTKDSEDDVMSKLVEAVTTVMGKQTAITVKNLANPLMGAT